MSIVIALEAETVLTVAADSTGSAILRRLSNVPGQPRGSNDLEFQSINLGNSATLQIGPFSTPRRYLLDSIIEGISYSYKKTKLNYNNLSTGVYEGGDLIINGSDNTKFDISAGKGAILDNYTDPEKPVVTRIEWPAFTAQTPEFIASTFTSYVAIDRGGNVVQFSGTINEENRRDYLILGLLVHTGNTNVESVSSFVNPGYDIANNLGDLSAAIGLVNITGNVFSADSTNLEIAKTAGTAFRLGGNFQDSRKSPNIATSDALSAPLLFKPYRDGSGGFTIDFPLTSSIDPDRYDDGSGTLATKPNNGRWSINRIFLDPINDNVIVQYGQNTYRNDDLALAAIQTETFEINPVLKDALLRGFLLVRKGATDLSNTNRALFIAADKFGQVPAQGAQLPYSNGIATVTSAPKSSDFTINLNKAYQVDNSSGSVTGTLAEATEDEIGKVCECWIQDDASINNFILEAPTESSIINGVSAGVGQLVRATVSSLNLNYKKISVTVIDVDTYLIDGVDSIVAS